MDLSTETRGRNTFYNAIATVQVLNATNDPVPGAIVSGCWSGLTSDTDSGSTDGSGVVSLLSDFKKRPGTYTFTVINVEHSEYNYNSSASVTSNSTIRS